MKKKGLMAGCMLLLLIGAAGCGGTADPDVDGQVVEDTDDFDAASQTQEVITDESEETEMQEDMDAGETENDVDSEELIGTGEDMDSTSNSQDVSTKNTDASEIPDDLYSFQLIINGQLYRIPMDCSEFVAMGWTYSGGEDVELAANTLEPMCAFVNGPYEIELTVVNDTDAPKPYSECKAVKIAVVKDYNWDNDISFTAPKGIKSGVSTMEDVKAAYGEPTDVVEGDGSATFYYEADEFKTQVIEFSFRDGILQDISMENSAMLW